MGEGAQRLKGESRETHSAHFLSPLYQHLARCCSRLPPPPERPRKRPRADEWPLRLEGVRAEARPHPPPPL